MHKHCWKHRPSLRNCTKWNRTEQWDESGYRQDNTSWRKGGWLTQIGTLKRGTKRNRKKVKENSKKFLEVEEARYLIQDTHGIPRKIGKSSNIRIRTVKMLIFKGTVLFISYREKESLHPTLNTKKQQNNINQILREKRVTRRCSQPNCAVTIKGTDKCS